MSDSLFGRDFALTPRERRRLTGKGKSPTPAGYVTHPGTGPKGETCGSCKHLFRNRMNKTYLKCELNRARWTSGRKSDILASAPACSMWETTEMAKFNIELQRRFWQYETQTIEVEAKSATEAKKIVRARMKAGEIDENAWDPGGGDCGYDCFDVENAD